MGRGFLFRFFRRLAGKEDLDKTERAKLAEARIESVIDEVEAEGLIDPDAHEMIHGVIDFAISMVRDVMVPRTEIVAVDVNSPVDQVIETINESGHSRIPVYSESIDKIIGLVYAKDLLRHWGTEKLDLTKVMREPYFIPETKRLDDLLAEFRSKRIHVAIVIDEYGGTSGVVSIEDLLEEIVGDISDEYDDDPELLIEAKSGGLVVSARLEIGKLFEHFDMEPPQGEFTTVGGWIFDHTGYIPQQGETIEISGFTIIVEATDERTVKRVRIARNIQQKVTE